MADLSSIIFSFVTLFVIMDPFPGIIPFLNFTKGRSDHEKKICATKAATIALILALVFLFAGPYLLNALKITLNDFRIGGGIIIALLGLETVLGFSFHGNKKENIEDIAALIATPLLTGPGVASSLIILSQENDVINILIALLGAVFLSWLILINSIKLRNIVGDRVIHIAGKVMGLLLLALGISYIRAGLSG